MSERKNIDRLFQEKFKDFEVNPPEDAWANIEARLDDKKKRRIVPFWWKLSGVAAVFLIGFLISKSIYDDGINPSNPIVNENNSNTKQRSTIEDANLKHLKENTIPTANPVVNEDRGSKSNQKGSEGINKNKGSNSAENGVASTSNEIKNSTASKEKKQAGKKIYFSTSAVTEKKSHNRSLKNKSNSEKDNAPVTESVFEKSQLQVAQNTKKNSKNQNSNPGNDPSFSDNNQLVINNKSTAEKELVQTDTKEKTNKETPTSVDQKNINLDALKGTVNSKIDTKETDKKVNDTATAITSVATNELEELLNEKESKKKESKKNRWQLASNVAPIFLGSVSNGSPIDSTLSKNSKSYNTNVGFGIGVSYAVSNKLSIRTGLNKVNMSYDTNDIAFFEGIQAKMLSGVQPNASSAMIHVESATANANPAFNPESGLLPFEAAFTHKNSGYLRQEMGYLEMPVEMTYNLLDKKFGIKIIGGFSTLFLQDNSITIISSAGDTKLGEANNLNDVHFSSNLGLGLKYNFLKSFEFNVEPTVKYQLNTYNSNAGNFKPYFFGIYSGISYNF